MGQPSTQPAISEGRKTIVISGTSFHALRKAAGTETRPFASNRCSCVPKSCFIGRFCAYLYLLNFPTLWEIMGFLPLSRPAAPRQRESAPEPARVAANLPGKSLRFRHARSTFVQNHQDRIQTVCKPGSVHTLAGAGRPFIWDGCYHPPLATNPGGKPEIALRPWLPMAPAAPIRFCSRWGLPCPFCYQKGGALLPHPFTLTRACPGGLLSVALSLGSPPPAVSRHRISVEPGLSSSGFPPAAAQPSGCRLPTLNA